MIPSAEAVAYAQIFSPETVLYNTPGIPNEADWEVYEAKRIALETRQRTYQKTGAYGGNCVQFAKKYLGQSGTWGNGGRALSLNSGPQVNAVVIFTYVHAAVVVADNGLAITIIESNYMAHNTIGYRTILKTDPTIKGYHMF